MSEEILNKEGFKQIKEALGELEDDLARNPINLELLKLKTMLSKRLKNIKNYFVPYVDMINNPLIEKIPIEEEILYCINVHVHWKVKPDISQDFDKLRAMKMQLKGNYHSYVFIFHKGLLLNTPHFLTIKTLVKSVGIYKTFPGLVPWNRVSILDNGNMIIDGYIKCDLERILEFEPESSFEFRKRIFKRDIIRMRHYYTLNCLEKARFYEKQNDYELALNWVENGFCSNVIQGEFDLIEDLMEVRASIHNKQIKIRMEKQEEIDNMIIDFFNSNAGSAYTLDSIMKRFENVIEKPDILDDLRENLEGILNKLIFNHKIQSNKHEDKIFYFLNQES